MAVSGSELHALMAAITAAKTAVGTDDEAVLAALDSMKVTLWNAAVPDLWEDIARVLRLPGGPGSQRSLLSAELVARAHDLGETALGDRLQRQVDEDEGEAEPPPPEDPDGGFTGFPGMPTAPPEDEDEELPEDPDIGQPDEDVTPVDPPPAGGDGEG